MTWRVGREVRFRGGRDSRHLEDCVINASLLKRRKHQSQKIWMHKVVGIGEIDSLASGNIQTTVPRTTCPSIRLKNKVNAGIYPAEVLANLGGSIGGPIVNQQQLKVWITLCKERAKAGFKIGGLIENRDDDGDGSRLLRLLSTAWFPSRRANSRESRFKNR